MKEQVSPTELFREAASRLEVPLQEIGSKFSPEPCGSTPRQVDRTVNPTLQGEGIKAPPAYPNEGRQRHTLFTEDGW